MEGYVHMKKRQRGADAPPIKEKLLSALDIVPDTLPREGMIEIRGRNYVNIKEGGRIILYTPEKITVEFGHGAVSVCGMRLVCTSYNAGYVRVDGLIMSVGFEEV